MKPVAILSSTILTDGTFTAETITPTADTFKGIESFVGHPNTKELLEHEYGAIPSPTPKFNGLQVGECYLAVPLMHNLRTEGFTQHQAIEGLKSLRVVLVTRIA